MEDPDSFCTSLLGFVGKQRELGVLSTTRLCGSRVKTLQTQGLHCLCAG